MGTAADEDGAWRGFATGLACGFSFGLMSFLVHRLGGALPASELTFFRAIFALSILLPFMLPHLGKLRDRRALWILLRSITGSLAMICLFANLQRTSIGTARSLGLFAPVLLVLASSRILKEPLRPAEIGAVGLTILGAALLYLPGSERPSWVVTALGFGGSTLACAALISLRRAAGVFPPTLIIGCLCTVLMLLSLVIPGDPWVMPGGALLPLAFGVCAAGLMGQWFLTATFRRLRAPIASSLSLTSLVWGISLEMAFEGARPKAVQYLSYALILGGVIALNLARSKPEPAPEPSPKEKASQPAS